VRLFLVSLLVSLVVHGLVAVSLVRLRAARAPRQTPIVHLEVSHVDFSVEAAEKTEKPQPSVQDSTPSPDPVSQETQSKEQARVIAPAKPFQSIVPKYPRVSRLRGEEGDVTLEIGVRSDGTVENAQVIASSGHVALDEAALSAVKSAQFMPATTDGRPTAASVRLTLQFRLK